MTNFGWHYPPGVTGREPEITGEWPADELSNEVFDVRKKVDDALDELIALLDDQGVLSKREVEDLSKAEQLIYDELTSVMAKLEGPDG